MVRKLSILGATGSIGRQTLEVVRAQKEYLSVAALSAFRHVEALPPLIDEFGPVAVAVGSAQQARFIQDQYPHLEVFWGEQGLVQAATVIPDVLVVNALVGAVGIRPTLEALRAGLDVALANKETMVAAGELVNAAAKASGAHVYPIDSEHSALAQCLHGYAIEKVEKLILTASGGPFRGRTMASLERVTAAEALSHPTWKMGPKITVDSATLMNKGLEVIEAHHLFGIPYSAIDILVHPQSIIHSMVSFCDGAILAQMGAPDMRVPIQYALLWNDGRMPADWPRLDFATIRNLTFEPPDFENFPALALAYACGEAGGTSPAVLNAANEVAAHAFLDGQLHFGGIVEVVQSVVEQHQRVSHPTIEDVFAADQWARTVARTVISERG